MRPKLKALLPLLVFCCQTVLAQQQDSTTVDERMSKTIEEVVITATVRPMKVTDDGAYLYDARTVEKTHPAANALELLSATPLVQRTGDDLTILGASSCVIMIDGRRSNLTQEQLKNMLAAMPTNRVRNIEVFYNTPAKYGVRGASININTVQRKTDHAQMSGSASLNGSRRHKFSYGGGADMLLSTKALTIGAGYEYSFLNKKRDLNLMTTHGLESTVHDINQQTGTSSRRRGHNIHADIDWKMTPASSLSVAYTAAFQRPESTASAVTTIDGNRLNDMSENSGRSFLHNVSAALKHKTMKIGSDLSIYRQRGSQHLASSDASTIDSKYRQKFLKATSYINNENKLGAFQLEYGLEFSYSRTDNTKQTGDTKKDDAPFSSTQTERTLSGFVGLDRSFGKQGFISLSVQAEHFRSEIDGEGMAKNTLWNDFRLYPGLTAMYRFNAINALQLSFSSERSYPAYWVTASNRTYINSYCAEEGNPLLRPATKYAVRLNHILRSKYIFGLFFETTDNYFTQLLTLKSDELVAVYKHINFSLSTKLGAMAVVPVKWAKTAETRLTAIVFNMRQKGNLDGTAFNNRKTTARINMSNTLSIIRNSLNMELSGWYQLPSVQGLYNVDAMYQVDFSLNYRPKIKGLSVVLRAEDVFDTFRMKVHTDTGRQKYSFRNTTDSRALTLTVKYNFNNYKLKKQNEANNRLGF